MASANDVKAAAKVKQALIAFDDQWANTAPEQFMVEYRALLRKLQADLGDMHPNSIVSMSPASIEKRHPQRMFKHNAAPTRASSQPLTHAEE